MMTMINLEDAVRVLDELQNDFNVYDSRQPPELTTSADHAITRAIAALRSLPAVADVPQDIVAIGALMHTQDNRCTAHPIFTIQQKRRIYGLDMDRCDNTVWLDECNDYHEATAEEAVELKRKEDAGEDVGDWYHTGYRDEWEFVTACFTEQGCKDYLAANGHNLNEPRIYVDSAHRNKEMQIVREFLMSAAPKEEV